MTLECPQRKAPISSHFWQPTDPIGNLVLKLLSNYASLWRENKSRTIYLKRRLFKYRLIVKGESFCIVDESVKTRGIVRLKDNMLVEISIYTLYATYYNFRL